MAFIDMSPLLGGINVGTVAVVLIAIAGVAAVGIVVLVGGDRVREMLSGDLADEKENQARCKRSQEWRRYRTMRMRAEADARNRSRDLALWRSGRSGHGRE